MTMMASYENSIYAFCNIPFITTHKQSIKISFQLVFNSNLRADPSLCLDGCGVGRMKLNPPVLFSLLSRCFEASILMIISSHLQSKPNTRVSVHRWMCRTRYFQLNFHAETPPWNFIAKLIACDSFRSLPPSTRSSGTALKSSLAVLVFINIAATNNLRCGGKRSEWAKTQPKKSNSINYWGMESIAHKISLHRKTIFRRYESSLCAFPPSHMRLSLIVTKNLIAEAKIEQNGRCFAYNLAFMSVSLSTLVLVIVFHFTFRLVYGR